MLKRILIATIPVLLAMSFSTPAYAYLDPGTGSIILQGIIAGIAMISLTLKMYWYKFTSLFRKNDKETEEDDGEDDSEGEKTGSGQS